ncbi:hypothetical protein PCI56_04250 [Plesiomonas shigelloides subsp. oncorhynchi]|nr:hypothetical protein [Plesiomonas shigelloides]MDA1379231.1 hypothetical protein [Plesiomonas shigelloides]
MLSPCTSGYQWQTRTDKRPGTPPITPPEPIIIVVTPPKPVSLYYRLYYPYNIATTSRDPVLHDTILPAAKLRIEFGFWVELMGAIHQARPMDSRAQSNQYPKLSGCPWRSC